MIPLDALDPDALDDRMLDLRSRGLSYESIRIVIAAYHGWRLTTVQVRNRCRQLGAAPHPVRQRARLAHLQRAARPGEAA